MIEPVLSNNPLWDHWSDVAEWQDPVVTEVRAIRREIDEMCDHDFEKYCDLLRRLEKEHRQDGSFRYADEPVKKNEE